MYAVCAIGRLDAPKTVTVLGRSFFVLAKSVDPDEIEQLRIVDFKYSIIPFSGEALGAIGDQEALPILESYSKDPITEVYLS